MRTLALFAVATTLTLGACASSGAAGSGARHSSSALTPAELTGGGFPNAYSAVEHLHPDWLRPQGGAKSLYGKAPAIAVFWENESSAYPVEMLRDLHSLDFKTIRHLSPTEAASRYGQDFSWGAIVVSRP